MGRNWQCLMMAQWLIRAPPSVRTPLPRGAALVNKPMTAQAFCHDERQALHGRFWGHTDLGSSSKSSTSCTEDLRNTVDLSGPGFPICKMVYDNSYFTGVL